MGAIHSGEVSDAVYYHITEKTWAADADVMVKFKVYVYARYRDGIFVCMENDTSLNPPIFSRHVRCCWEDLATIFRCYWYHSCHA